MIDFSIIIPVYNAEKTLKYCLDSLRRQTKNDFEVILIDDGSTDNSKSICIDYTIIDSRFTYYYQPNNGPSAARNKGIKLSKGHYLLFVDSDDYVSDDYLSEIEIAINNKSADLIFFGYKKMTPNGEILADCVPDVSNFTDMISIAIELSNKDLFGYTCIKAFRKDIIGDIKFNENINILEDELFTCSVLSKCKSVDVITKSIYNYIIQTNSNALTFRTHQNYCEICDFVFLAWKNLLCDYTDSINFLSKMSINMVNKCMYYYYERNVDTKTYINQLSDCNFFHYVKPESFFSKKVQNKSYFLLNLLRFIYRKKIYLYKFIHKNKKRG